jgi:hypothetical protein
VEQNLTEKYLLSELPEAEREEFELHYFSCPECAAALRDGALFVDAARDLLPPVSLPQPRPSFWERWFPGPARPAFAAMTALLVMVSGVSWQQVRQLQQKVAGYESPRQVPGFTLLASRRGPQQTFTVPKGAREVQFLLDVSADETFPRYEVQIGSGKPIPVVAPQAGGLVQILVPVTRLPRGLAALRVRGVRPDGSQADVNTYQINIQESP